LLSSPCPPADQIDTLLCCTLAASCLPGLENLGGSRLFMPYSEPRNIWYSSESFITDTWFMRGNFQYRIGLEVAPIFGEGVLT
jgi:hypothetical protein